jgi:uncharacterized membrane protein
VNFGRLTSGQRDLADTGHVSRSKYIPILCVCAIVIAMLGIASVQSDAPIVCLILLGAFLAVIKLIRRRIDQNLKEKHRTTGTVRMKK